MMGRGPYLEHEQYEELCALATAGALNPAESDRLRAHLESCAECREASAQYQVIARDGMAFLAENFASPADADGFDESSALKRLMQETEADTQPAPLTDQRRKALVWNQGWVRGLAAASIVLGVAIAAYQQGSRSAGTRLQAVTAQSRSALDRVNAEKRTLQQAIEADHQQLAALEQQTITATDHAEKLRTQAQADAQHMAEMTDAMDATRNESDAQLAALRQERDASAGKLRDMDKLYQAAQYELNMLRSQHQQDLLHLASLQAGADRLAEQFNQQSRRARADEHYLAADKDIRDLIGARNLYIADIMDVNDSGESRKPFGRVFYTKTKSLVFYAYDLDRQPGVRRTSTFQVWGRTGPDDRKPINLGILYMDSATNRRWTLRVDNPEQLARLDSVFVTIEPHEQTERPTGKPFLYASLQRVANHP